MLLFLTRAKVDPGVIPVYQTRTQGEWGVGIDAEPALDCWAQRMPGFQGMNLEPGGGPHMSFTAAGYANGGSYNFHFPDGNASIARLLVRSLIPRAVPGSTAEDVVTAVVDYSHLDQPDSRVCESRTRNPCSGSVARRVGRHCLSDVLA